MENGYKILWTEHALSELSEVYEYLEFNFTNRELNRLSIAIENTIQLILKDPELFPFLESKSIRRAVVLKYNTLYYRINGNIIEIVSFFNNRKNPKKRNF